MAIITQTAIRSVPEDTALVQDQAQRTENAKNDKVAAEEKKKVEAKKVVVEVVGTVQQDALEQISLLDAGALQPTVPPSPNMTEASLRFAALCEGLDAEDMPDIDALPPSFSAEPEWKTAPIASLPPQALRLGMASERIEQRALQQPLTPERARRIELVKACSLVMARSLSKREEQITAAQTALPNLPKQLQQKILEVSPKVAAAYRAWLKQAPVDKPDDVPEIPSPLVVELERAAQALSAPMKTAFPPEVISAGFSGGLHMSDLLATADVEMLIILVMMESTRLEDELLRDQMQEVSKRNNIKKAQREKIAAVRQSQAKLDSAMKLEFNELIGAGQINSSWTFDDYKAWRSVAWGDGETSENGTWKGPAPTLTPRPPLPSYFSMDKNASAVPGAVQTDDADVNTAAAFGLDASQAAMLKDVFARGGYPEGTDFRMFLKQFVGLSEANTFGEIAANNTKLLEFLCTLRGSETAGDIPEIAKPGEIDPSVSADNLRMMEDLMVELAAIDIMIEASKTASVAGSMLSSLEMKRADVLAKLNEKLGEPKALLLEDAKALQQFQSGTGLKNRLTQFFDAMQSYVGECERDLEDFNRDMDLLDYRNGIEAEPEEWPWPPQGSQSPQPPIDDPAWLIYNSAGAPMNLASAKRWINACDVGADQFQAGKVTYRYPIDAPDWSRPDSDVPDPLSTDSIESYIATQQGYVDSLLKVDEAADDEGKYSDDPFGVDGSYLEFLKSKGAITEVRTDEEVAADEAKVAEAAAFEEARNQGGLNHVGTIAELDAYLETEKGKLDSMSEMAELDMLRMQSLMERRAKMIQALSNMLEKIANTGDALVKNMS